jgi:signal transduction histidine kinase
MHRALPIHFRRDQVPLTALKLNIKTKMLLLLLVVAVLGATASIFTIVNTTREFIDEILPQKEALHDIETNSQLLFDKYHEYVIFPRESTLEQIADLRAKTINRVPSYLKTASNQREAIEFIKQIRASVISVDEAGKQIVDLVKLLEQNYPGDGSEQIIESNFTEAELLMNKAIRQLIEQGNFESDVKKSITELRTIKKLRVLLLELLEEFKEFLNNPTDEAVTKIRKLEILFQDATKIYQLEQQKSVQKSSSSERIISISRDLSGRIVNFVDNRDKLQETIVNLDIRSDELKIILEEILAFAAREEQELLEDALASIIATILVALIISFLCLYWGLSRLTAPISYLQSVMGRFGDGDLIERAKVSSHDELGQLALSFNSMADQLEKNAREQNIIVTQLEQKNTELERFTYTASHDLKSPLVTIKGFLGLLEKDLELKDQDRVQKDMLQITSAADKMSRLLDDLLEISRVGQVVNQPEIFTLNELSEEVLFLLQGAIAKSGAVIDFAANMPPVFADRRRIQEVLQNLLENAIKFSGDNNTPKISISAELKDNKVLCKVRDNGIGIEPRFQEVVFQLFDRLEVNVEGTGVGLALVQRIIELHDGEIWIESEGIGRGSLFCFTLPPAPENSNEN